MGIHTTGEIDRSKINTVLKFLAPSETQVTAVVAGDGVCERGRSIVNTVRRFVIFFISIIKIQCRRLFVESQQLLRKVSK